MQEARLWPLGQRAGGGALGQLDVVVNQHAVVPHGDPGVGGLLPVLAVLGRGEVDVIGLPLEGGETHVQVGILDGIDATALVVFAGEPKRIKHLHFVTSLQVAAAVGATLTTASRFVRQAELEVQLVTLKLGDAVGALHQQAVLGHLARLEILGGLAIEQHGCALGRLGTERRALADGTFDGE